MCDPITAGLCIGGGAALVGESINLVQDVFRQGELNDAVETQYNNELAAARRSYQLETFNASEEARSELMQSRSDERKERLAKLVSDEAGANASAAMGVAGNTPMRGTGVNRVTDNLLSGEYGAKEDTIANQQALKFKNARENLAGNYEGAYNTALANSRDIVGDLGLRALGSLISIGSGAAQGGLLGASPGGKSVWNTVIGPSKATGVLTSSNDIFATINRGDKMKGVV